MIILVVRVKPVYKIVESGVGTCVTLCIGSLFRCAQILSGQLEFFL